MSWVVRVLLIGALGVGLGAAGATLIAPRGSSGDPRADAADAAPAPENGAFAEAPPPAAEYAPAPRGFDDRGMSDPYGGASGDDAGVDAYGDAGPGARAGEQDQGDAPDHAANAAADAARDVQAAEAAGGEPAVTARRASDGTSP